MLLDKKNIITVLRKEKETLHENIGVKNIALFGSYAKDLQKENSDIDFLVEQKEISYTSLVKTLLFLENKFPGKKIQLTRKGPHLSDRFLESIKNDLIYV